MSFRTMTATILAAAIGVGAAGMLDASPASAAPVCSGSATRPRVLRHPGGPDAGARRAPALRSADLGAPLGNIESVRQQYPVTRRRCGSSRRAESSLLLQQRRVQRLPLRTAGGGRPPPTACWDKSGEHAAGRPRSRTTGASARRRRARPSTRWVSTAVARARRRGHQPDAHDAARRSPTTTAPSGSIVRRRPRTFRLTAEGNPPAGGARSQPASSPASSPRARRGCVDGERRHPGLGEPARGPDVPRPDRPDAAAVPWPRRWCGGGIISAGVSRRIPTGRVA